MNYMDYRKSPVELDWHFITPDTKAGRMMIKRMLRSDVKSRFGWASQKQRFVDCTKQKNGEIVASFFISNPYYERREDVFYEELPVLRKAEPWWDLGGGCRCGVSTSRSGVTGQWHWAAKGTDEQEIREEQRWHYEEAQVRRLEEERKKLALRREIENAFIRRGGSKSRKRKQIIALGIPA